MHFLSCAVVIAITSQAFNNSLALANSIDALCIEDKADCSPAAENNSRAPEIQYLDGLESQDKKRGSSCDELSCSDSFISGRSDDSYWKERQSSCDGLSSSDSFTSGDLDDNPWIRRDKSERHCIYGPHGRCLGYGPPEEKRDNSACDISQFIPPHPLGDSHCPSSRATAPQKSRESKFVEVEDEKLVCCTYGFRGMCLTWCRPWKKKGNTGGDKEKKDNIGGFPHAVPHPNYGPPRS